MPVCLDEVVKALNSPTLTDWLTFAVVGLGTLTMSAVAATIAVWTFRFDQRRALASDRERLRSDLRAWFQTLSRSAPRSVRKQRRALRSRIDEAAQAEGWVEIFELMDWATTMHDESYVRIASGEIDPAEAHLRRVIIKRRFRQFISVWARSRRDGRRLFKKYIRKGWNAIAAEPPTAEYTARKLNDSRRWGDLPDAT